MQHKLQGNVYLSEVTHVIIDEVDTMLMQGFGSDIRAILRSVMTHRTATATANDRSTITDAGSDTAPSVVLEKEEEEGEERRAAQPAQLIMATATLTKAVRSLLTDVEGGFNIEYSGWYYAHKLCCMCWVLRQSKFVSVWCSIAFNR
jgi:superfamily II DNA/RNA helicase